LAMMRLAVGLDPDQAVYPHAARELNTGRHRDTVVPCVVAYLEVSGQA
jgi:hypothetical protein